MSKDKTQLLRHCERLLQIVSIDMMSICQSGFGRTVKQKVINHTSYDIRVVASIKDHSSAGLKNKNLEMQSIPMDVGVEQEKEASMIKQEKAREETFYIWKNVSRSH